MYEVCLATVKKDGNKEARGAEILYFQERATNK